MNHTQNYQLSQWEPGDPVLRTDFNADNAKLDAAIAGLPRVVCGSYVGDGAESRVIPLPYTPKAVLLGRKNAPLTVSVNNSTGYFGGLALFGSPKEVLYGGNLFEIVENGIKVYYRNEMADTIIISTNLKNATYHYLALI